MMVDGSEERRSALGRVMRERLPRMRDDPALTTVFHVRQVALIAKIGAPFLFQESRHADREKRSDDRRAAQEARRVEEPVLHELLRADRRRDHQTPQRAAQRRQRPTAWSRTRLFSIAAGDELAKQVRSLPGRSDGRRLRRRTIRSRRPKPSRPSRCQQAGRRQSRLHRRARSSMPRPSPNWRRCPRRSSSSPVGRVAQEPALRSGDRALGQSKRSRPRPQCDPRAARSSPDPQLN